MLNPAVYHVLCWGFGIAVGVAEGLHYNPVVYGQMNMVVLSIDPLPGSSRSYNTKPVLVSSLPLFSPLPSLSNPLVRCTL